MDGWRWDGLVILAWLFLGWLFLGWLLGWAGESLIVVPLDR